jgi:putative transcriptional regulator
MTMQTRKPQTSDWARVDAMTDDEAYGNALCDPDNPPLTAEQLRALPRMPQVKVIRRAFGLTQEEFSARYQIPLGTLRDWDKDVLCPTRRHAPI